MPTIFTEKGKAIKCPNGLLSSEQSKEIKQARLDELENSIRLIKWVKTGKAPNKQAQEGMKVACDTAIREIKDRIDDVKNNNE